MAPWYGGRAALTERVPELAPAREFFWMDTTSRPDIQPGGAEWLDEGTAKEAAPLFNRYFPDSHAQPGRSGVRRWAGILGDRAGGTGAEPVAVAAEAWSAVGCGFMAGVLTHPAVRGRGLAYSVSAFVADALICQYGRAALMVDEDNVAAVAMYERLGMVRRRFGAAVPVPG